MMEFLPTKIMDRECCFKVGDWVRFYKDGKMVIGVIQYIQTPVVGQEYSLQTDEGEIPETLVVEARRGEASHESV